jgi:hypothetical protein
LNQEKLYRKLNFPEHDAIVHEFELPAAKSK